MTRPIACNDVLIVASQDCDICCESLEDEPNFEVLVARRIPDDLQNGNLNCGKHPRRLQFRVNSAEGQDLYESNINERLSLSRQLLIEADEQPTISLSENDAEVFRRWLGRRYYRSALPSEFNERCEPAKSYISEKLKKKGRIISSIYFQLDPRYEELNRERDYRVFIHLIVEPETADSKPLLEEALSVQTIFQTGFAKCTGIELLGARVVSEADFSLYDIRLCARWDHSDHTSFRAELKGAIAPES